MGIETFKVEVPVGINKIAAVDESPQLRQSAGALSDNGAVPSGSTSR